MKHQNKFKLTPQVYKQLMEIAHDLPQLQQLTPTGKPMYRAKPVFVGTDLTREAALNKMGYRNTIQRNKEPLLVNHEVQLIDRYQRLGMDAVNAYAAKCREIAAQYEEPAQ